MSKESGVLTFGKHREAEKVASDLGMPAKPGRHQVHMHPEMLQAINLECEAGKNGGKKLVMTDLTLGFWAEWLKSRGVTVPENWTQAPKEWRTTNPDFMKDEG
ncbi:hypothetical protein N2U02_004489 [Salmonella enterica]|nr:hypothetical protein [Salmonella enterica]